MSPRGGESHRRRAPALEASPWQHPGYSRRASRPTSCPPRSKCCSSPGGEGTSSTQSCCRRCSHSRTPHAYRSSATFWLLSRSIEDIVRQIFTPVRSKLFFLRCNLLLYAPASSLQQLLCSVFLVPLALPRSHACPHRVLTDTPAAAFREQRTTHARLRRGRTALHGTARALTFPCLLAS